MTLFNPVSMKYTEYVQSNLLSARSSYHFNSTSYKTKHPTESDYALTLPVAYEAPTVKNEMVINVDVVIVPKSSRNRIVLELILETGVKIGTQICLYN